MAEQGAGPRVHSDGAAEATLETPTGQHLAPVSLSCCYLADHQVAEAEALGSLCLNPPRPGHRGLCRSGHLLLLT